MVKCLWAAIDYPFWGSNLQVISFRRLSFVLVYFELLLSILVIDSLNKSRVLCQIQPPQSQVIVAVVVVVVMFLLLFVFVTAFFWQSFLNIEVSVCVSVHFVVFLIFLLRSTKQHTFNFWLYLWRARVWRCGYLTGQGVKECV